MLAWRGTWSEVDNVISVTMKDPNNFLNYMQFASYDKKPVLFKRAGESLTLDVGVRGKSMTFTKNPVTGAA